MEKLLAHIVKSSDGKVQKEQLLLNHLKNCAIYSREIGTDIGIPTICFLIGLLHDTGKSSTAFQQYIRGSFDGRVIHSSTGARFLEVFKAKLKKKIIIKHMARGGNPKNTEFVNEIKVAMLYVELMQYAILAHHGLFDCIENNIYKFGERLIINDKLGENQTDEDKFLNLLDNWTIKVFGASLYDFFEMGYKEFVVWNRLKEDLLKIYGCEESNDKNDASAYYSSCMARVLLSVLKEADIYDSSNFGRILVDEHYDSKKLQIVWNDLEKEVTNFYNQFEKPTSLLNEVRTKLADEVFEKATKCENGNYKLDMPVGSGKTYAALRFAIKNARYFKKRRIFYTTAFLSVLEQNAQEIRNVLTNKGAHKQYDKYVLEHHSNVITESVADDKSYNIEKSNFATFSESEDYDYISYLRESWEAPVVLTTLVQLSNTLFSGKSASIRRFCKLINSTIIIDEIQSLPPEIIYNFNLMMNFLTHMMKVTLVHCTATPPGYDQKKVLAHPCVFGNDFFSELTSKVNSMNPIFARVNYKSLLGINGTESISTESLIDHILKRLKLEKSILVVLNTKKAVINLYDALKKMPETEKVKLYNLTTNQCAAHRLEYINSIKLHLKELREGVSQTQLICISTNLIEAGVDVDFDVVYRSLIGIDSIMQSAGRCNREGKKEKGNVYIFKYGDESLKKLKLFQQSQDATKSILARIDKSKWHFNKDDSSYLMLNPISEILVQYNRCLYQLIGNNDKYFFEYPIKNRSLDTTMFQLLGSNSEVKDAYRVLGGNKRIGILNQSFKTAAQNFHLIADDTITVIVQYKNKDLIDKLCTLIENLNMYNATNEYAQLKILLKKLQRYTISIRRELLNEYKISQELAGQIYILQADDYDMYKGLINGGMNELIF